MDITLVLVAILLFVLFVHISKGILKQSNGINVPGPLLKLPVVGHLPFVGKNPYKTFQKWKKQYGPVVACQLGSFKVVLVHGAKRIRKVYSNPSFSGRPDLPFMLDRSGGEPKGIISTSGREWQEVRRTVLRTLKDAGLGKSSIETNSIYEATEILNKLGAFAESKQPLSTSTFFNSSVLSVLWALTMGERVDPNDLEMNRIIEILTRLFFENDLLTRGYVFMPWYSKYFPNLSGYNYLMNQINEVVAVIAERVEKRETACKSSSVDSLIDKLIERVKTTDDPDSFFFEEKGKKTLTFVIVDLFIGGVETTSTVLQWLLLYMAKYQKFQELLYEEIMAVVGLNDPTLDDRKRLPLVEAVIHESLRFSSPLPLSLFHEATETAEIDGYTVPKGSMIVSNIYDVHYDEDTWGNPNEFQPFRFINDDGVFKKRDEFLAFSTGKRNCLGQSLALDELFLFTVKIFQNFQICQIDGRSDMLSTEPNVSAVLKPQPHQLLVKRRS